ncbi:MAG: hypothetical protein COA70_10385 [Planctomycetota bacterium]|nr:MAG: hypothetical protein COA70_10385 [Planctomycetota bacterium]
MFFLHLLALAAMPLAQEPTHDSQYFTPDWIPGTTELYYGPSFLDRSYPESVNFVLQVDLGLVDFYHRPLSMGGAEHLGALFFISDEEVQQAGFPFNVENSSVAPKCPVLRQQAGSATAEDSAGVGSRRES